VRSILKYQVPALIWAIGIFILSSIEGLSYIEVPIIYWDKLAHMFVYFVFCWLAYRAFFYQDRWMLLKQWSLLSGFLLVVIYGYLDEIHQSFVPGRNYDVYDMLANAIGAGLFVLIIMYYGKKRRQKL